MNTIAWIFILIAFILIRLAWKGQIIDEDGNVIVTDQLSKLWVGLVTNDSKAINEVLSGTSAGLNTPSVDTGGSFDADGGYAGGGSGGGSGGSWSFNLRDSLTPKSWDSLNPRTVDEAVEYALNRKTFASGMCERMVTLAYGHSGGFPTARAHADAMTLRSGVPPRGALVFHATKNPAQHVCLSVGNGYIVSTDFDGKNYRSGAMSVGPIDAIDKWGPRRGWSPPLFPGSKR